MNNKITGETRINQYLDEVESYLSVLSEEERIEILNNLRAHIDNELENRRLGQPTLEDVEAVLLDMDPPKSYAESASYLTADEPQDKRVSKYSIIGTIILPFGFFLALLFFPIRVSTSPTSPTTWEIILRYTLLPVSIIAPFATTALGLLGISEIRTSKGKIYGMPLAVFISLFYPIIVVTIILIMLGWTLLGDIEGWNILPIIWLTVVLVVDYIIIRFTWRAATRK